MLSFRFANSLKRVLLSKVDLWIVAVLLSLTTLGFGAFMKDGAERSAPRGGALGRVAFRIGSTPQSLYHRWLTGLGQVSLPPPPSVARHGGEAGYLAVARFPPTEKDGDKATVVEIIDLDRRKSVHRWKRFPRESLHRFNVLPDGSLLAGNMNRTFRMDACSNVVWEQPLRAHHSYERGVDGDFWSAWHTSPNTIPHMNPDFVEDGVIRFSSAGEVLSRTTLTSALMQGGHTHLLYHTERYARSLLQLNDVEPVLQDGPFWRRGDLFVSLRAVSVVLLYRPATDEVLWLQAGPWQRQHDVDVVSDSEISVYSNNTIFDEHDRARILGANEVYIHDFATGETRSPWREAMRRHDVRTLRRGGATLFSDGSVMLEEADSGRVLILSPDGEKVWSYVNRASDGMVYEILASRWLDAEYGGQVARSIALLDCGAEMD